MDTYPNPLRPLDWRYRRAAELAEQHRLSFRAAEDGWIRDMARFLRNFRRFRKPEQHDGLSGLMPDLYRAYELFMSDPVDRRWAVEARLLSGESVDRIADKTNNPPTAIELYHHLYFDIRDSLDAPDYIANAVIDHQRDRFIWDDRTEVFWRFVGYHCGPEALDVLIDGAADAAAAGKLHRFLMEHAHTTLQQRVAILARAISPHDKSFVKNRTKLKRIAATIAGLGKYISASRTDQPAVEENASPSLPFLDKSSTGAALNAESARACGAGPPERLMAAV